MERRFHLAFSAGGAALFTSLVLAGALLLFFLPPSRGNPTSKEITEATPSSFVYTFNKNGVLHEAKTEDTSTSPYFWLNSGGMLLIDGGVGKTIQGKLPTVDAWRLRYALSNPTDTDNGYQPQNLFRLITKNSLKDSQQEVYVRILNTNLTNSPNRNGSNGILLMSRFVDGDNLYYGGIRVDGYAVIKRKRDGRYETLALTPLFNRSDIPYDRNSSPNVLPSGTWIGLRLVTESHASGGTELTLYVDLDGTFKRVAAVYDSTPLQVKSGGRGGVAYRLYGR